ncbi:FKBP-type peptidyl-prolyl cis-trans isomerase [Inmirania thermothiophila]|uniref:Peptidyl-prolyl cis-trans isomerase n=1 Tax=Inmirania thermothiophila TaxID=1750597 RepID=A0A3N1Y4I3_9GAMM|nr:peptidylprolyl isomerase [Inmirania thermothiophila]ROR32512.1 peptidylprolyl isomerase [Inmirania thermothiophila]
MTTAQAKTGDTVKVHYTGTLDDGTVFDSSRGREPLEFTIGEGMLIPGFEEAVIGMSVGERKSVSIGSDDAYGPRHEEMVQTIDRAVIPEDIDLEVGTRLTATGPGEQPLLLTVVELTEDTVTVDANHPLAGKDLTFEIELVEIV